MDVDDGDAVPTDDAIARSARRAFAGMADPPAPSWDAVRVRARYLQRLRMGVAGAIVLALLVGVTATVAAAGGSSRSVHIEEAPTTTTTTGLGENTATTTSGSTTTTTTVSTGGASSTDVTSVCAACPVAPPVTGETTPPPPESTTSTTFAHAAADNLDLTLDSVDPTTLTVGQSATLRGTIHNKSSVPVETSRYFSVFVGCARPNFPFMTAPPYHVLAPGETLDYAVEWTATDFDVGTAYCRIVIDWQGQGIASDGPGSIAITVLPASPPPS